MRNKSVIVLCFFLFEQLGGVDIMDPSGVTHITVETDHEGIAECLKWLSFVPAKHRELVVPLPFLTSDSVTRRIEFTPSKKSYDPRGLLGGVDEPGRSWIGGFFDQVYFGA
jgi:acetyl-CoA carboxylase/biotin carboxylase 1